MTEEACQEIEETRGLNRDDLLLHTLQPCREPLRRISAKSRLRFPRQNLSRFMPIAGILLSSTWRDEW